MWIKNFKIALAQEDTKKLEELTLAIPKFDNIQDIKQVMYLLKGASELFTNLKYDTAENMKQIKTTKDFVNSTQAPSSNKLDIKS